MNLTRQVAISIAIAGALPLAVRATPHVARCPVLAANDPYNRRVTLMRPDRHSPKYIASMQAAGNAFGFDASPNLFYINLAGARTPTIAVRPKVRWHSFPRAYPWTSAYRIEPLSDAHAIVLDLDRCQAYELYNATTDGGLTAYSGITYDLRARYQPRQFGQPSAMASGLPLLPGMVRWDEVASGHVPHALNWSGIAGTVAGWRFVAPASSTDGTPYRGVSRYRLPYGARLRLKASFDVASLPRQARTIARAMQEYGIFLADTGRYGNHLFIANALDGSNPWDARDLASLGRIHISDFDVLPLPPSSVVPGHTE